MVNSPNVPFKGLPIGRMKFCTFTLFTMRVSIAIWLRHKALLALLATKENEIVLLNNEIVFLKKQMHMLKNNMLD